MTEVLTIGHFLPLINTSFRLEVEGIGRVELVLEEVNDLGPRPDLGDFATRDRTFALIFRGCLLGAERNLYLRQGTYPLEQETLGRIDMFLVPLGPDKAGMRYEAIFN